MFYRRGLAYAFMISGVRRSHGTIGDLWRSGFRTTREAADARNEMKTKVARGYVKPTKAHSVESFSPNGSQE